MADAAASGVIAKSNEAVENAARQVEETVQEAIHTANIANNRPTSVSRANIAQKAATVAQEARSYQVGQEIVNSIIATSPTTTNKVIGGLTLEFYSEYDKNKEYKMAVPVFGQ